VKNKTNILNEINDIRRMMGIKPKQLISEQAVLLRRLMSTVADEIEPQIVKFSKLVDNELDDAGSIIKRAGDSNPLMIKYIDDWHNGQSKAIEGKTEEAIKLMTTAADEAEKLAIEELDGGMAGEANYYRGTIAWLEKDYSTVQKYINDKFVKMTGNDEVLKRLIQNKDKSYKEAYSN
jgi:hypothetical protein